MSFSRVAALFAVIVALAIAIWRPSDTGGIVTALEGRTLDARFALRGVRDAPPGVMIIGIDDATLASLDAFPPPRDALAQAVTAVRQGGGQGTAFDLLLSGEGRGDAVLSRMLSEGSDVILAASLSQKFLAADPITAQAASRSALALVTNTPGDTTPVGILGPAPEFARHATLGHVNVVRETDGALRRIPMARAAADGIILPALPLEAARRMAGLERGALRLDWGKTLHFGGRSIALNRDNEAGINFYGPRGAVETISLAEAITGAGAARMAGRMVFVGATAEGYGDTFATPFDRSLPGVEALATMAANLLDGTHLRRDGATWGADIVLAVLAAFTCVFAASRAKPIWAVGGTVAVWAGVLAIVQGAFVQSIWLDGVTPLAALAVATLAGGGARWMDHRQRAANLSHYQSPFLSEILAASARPGFDGRVQKAAALFVDAADFTARTARLGPVRTTAFLRGFHAAVERAAIETGGVIENYAGDGAMICFGLPDPQPEDARNALRCAERLFAEIDALSAREVAGGDAPLTIRIGAHWGDVSVAVLGGHDHRHVTLVGDIVNLASRLQETAKQIGAELAVSDALVAAAGGGEDYGLAPHGPHSMRGSDVPLDVWARMPGRVERRLSRT